MNNIDPKSFGLPSRTVLEQTSEKTITLVINRKSRLIMADSKRILEKVNKIKSALPEVEVKLRTSAPICGKARNFLMWEGIKMD